MSIHHRGRNPVYIYLMSSPPTPPALQNAGPQRLRWQPQIPPTRGPLSQTAPIEIYEVGDSIFLCHLDNPHDDLFELSIDLKFVNVVIKQRVLPLFSLLFVRSNSNYFLQLRFLSVEFGVFSMRFQIFRIPIDCQPQHLEPVA